jgi:hypothetical protein
VTVVTAAARAAAVIAARVVTSVDRAVTAVIAARAVTATRDQSRITSRRS